MGPSPLWLGDELEFWPEKQGVAPIRFTAIAALHSELVAVSSSGHLYQWCWTDLSPQRGEQWEPFYTPNVLRLRNKQNIKSDG